MVFSISTSVNLTPVAPVEDDQNVLVHGDVTGVIGATTVVKLNGNPITAQALGASTDGYILTWDNADGYWVAKPAPTGFAAGGDLSGTATNQSVIKLHGNPVSATALGLAQDGYVLTWNNAANEWQAEAVAASLIAGRVFTFTNNASNIATYKTLEDFSTGTSTDLSVSITGASGKTLMAAFATTTGNPNVTTIPQGIIQIDFFRYVDTAAGTSTITFDLYHRTVGGVETLISTYTTNDINDLTPTLETVQFAIISPVTVLASEVLVMKVSATTTGSAHVIHFLYDGTTTPSHFHSTIVGGSFTLGGDATGNTANVSVVSLTGASGVVSVPTAAIAMGSAPAAIGDIRGSGDWLIAHRVGGVDRTVLEATTGADVIIGDPTNGGSIINRTPNGGNIYHQVGGVNQLTVQSDGTHLNTYPLILGTTPATVGDIRLPNVFNISRDGGSSTNETIMATTSNTLSIGGPASGTSGQFFSNLTLNGFSQITSSINGVTKMNIDSSGVSMSGMTVIGSGIQFNSGTTISMGAAPASTGDIRLSAATDIKIRNAANTADINLIHCAANAVLIGNQANLSSVEIYANQSNLWGTTSAGIYNTSGAGFALQVTSNKIALTQPLAIGTNPATTGDIRLPTSGSVYMRNAANSGDQTIITTGTNSVTFGDASGTISAVTLTAGNSGTTTITGFNLALNATASAGVDIGAASAYGILVTNTSISVAQPVKGYVANSSPYGLHGVGVQAMADANQTVAATIYCFYTIKTTGAITANRNLVLPAATDAAGYTKMINNACTGAFNVIVGDGGAGTTVTIGNGKSAMVLLDSRGATRLTADV